MDVGLRYIPVGYQQLTVGGTVVSLTVPAGAVLAIFNTETTALRWRDDGGNLAATFGMPLPITGTGPLFEYSGNLAAIQFLSSGAAGTLNVSYYKISG